MEEAEAAKAGQRAATELAKLEPTEVKESLAEVYLQQVSAEQQANKRRREGKRNRQRKYQQTQKRFQHKCRAHKYRKKDDAKGEKEIKLIKGMGASGMQPSKGNAVAQSNSACHRVAESNSQQTGLISPQAKPQVSSAYYRQDSRSTLPKPQV